MAAGLILTCLVIGFGMMAWRECRQLGTVMLHSIEERTEYYKEYEWDRYEREKINGADIISAIRLYQNQFPVYVIKHGKTRVYTGNFVYADNIAGQDDYIGLEEIYSGTVLRDEKDAVCGLEFTYSE